MGDQFNLSTGDPFHFEIAFVVSSYCVVVVAQIQEQFRKLEDATKVD